MLTPEGFRNWFGDQTLEVSARELAAASAEVRAALVAAVYTVNAFGEPADLAVANAIDGACYEQVRARQLEAELTVNPLGVRLQSATIDGTSWTAAQGGGAWDGRALAPAAELLVRSIPRRVETYG